MSQAVRSTGRERLTRVVAATSLLVSTAYIVWRWGWTLAPDALWLSVPLVLAESYGVMAAALFAFNAWRPSDRRAEPAPVGRSVDVFITAYDEPITLIRKTALAARELRYPHATYLLDDGHRDEIRLLAVELGIGYVKRADRIDAKGGNLNHALRLTTGELILQLDADHLPLPHMLDRLVGFFSDEHVAFVQSPQGFYDAADLGHDATVQRRRLWDDEDLFFRVIQPGRDRHNAAAFAGSCGMVRRTAIEQLGGFATQSVTEALETSLLLHGRGWRSAYLNESLAVALTSASARTFHLRHHHWGQGVMQTLRSHHPAATRGLTLAQRIGYLSSVVEPFAGFQGLVFYLTPLVFLLTGVFPIQASATRFGALYLPHLLLGLLSYRLLSRGHGAMMPAQRVRMARFFTDVRAVTAYLTPKRRLPDATAGVPPRDSIGLAAPQIVLVALTALALAWALYGRAVGVRTPVPGWGEGALWASVALALWYALLATQVIRLSVGSRHQRGEHRFAESLAVTTRVFRSDGKLASSDIAVTENLNPAGLALRSMFPLEKGSRIEISLPLNTREVSVRGRVVQQSTSQTQLGTVYLAGVEFDPLSQNARDAIELHCAHHALPRQRLQAPALARGALRRLQELRGEERMAVGMPARVTGGMDGEEQDLGTGLLEDMSARGGRVLLDHSVDEGTMLTLHIPGSPVSARGRVVVVTPLETSVGTRYAAGFMTEGEDREATAGVSRWFAEYNRLVAVYGDVVLARSRLLTAATTRLFVGLKDRETVIEPGGAPTPAPPVQSIGVEDQPAAPLAEAPFPLSISTSTSTSTAATATARDLEADAVLPPDSDFTVEGEFSFPGELQIGGSFIVTESGCVSADIAASNAFIRGTFTGTLTASGTIFATSSARITGRLQGSEVVLLEGAMMTGDVVETRVGAVADLPTEAPRAALEPTVLPMEPSSSPVSEGESPPVEPAMPWAVDMPEEEMDPDVEIFIPPRVGTHGVRLS